MDGVGRTDGGWGAGGGYATICRLCMQRDGFMLGIFNHVPGKEKSLYKKIMEITDLQISSGDGLPTCICHKCLYKTELCHEFKQQCTMADATFRQITGLPSKQIEERHLDPSKTYQHDDVVMVVDPNVMDYDSEYDSENEQQSDAEGPDLSDLHEFRNVFMCKYCDQAFTQRTDCANHESTAHNRAVPYTCVECDMSFGDRNQYSAHLKSIHQNDKPYNCPQCERTFARRSDLRKHTVVHTGIKPFTCSVCFKSFSRNTNLSKHMRIHSGHKPFVCPKCPKTFFTKGDLTRHSIIHSGQKPFRCNYCNLSFGRRDKLQRHERRHFPQNMEDKSQELELMRQNLALNDFSCYNSMIPTPKDDLSNENDQAEDNKQEEWGGSSSVNMVINLDPFSHNGSYDNPELSTPRSDRASGMETPSVTDHCDSEFNGAPSRDQLDLHASIKIEPGFDDAPVLAPLPPIREHITADSFHVIHDDKPPPLLNSNGTPAAPPVVKRYPCLRCNKRFVNSDALSAHMIAHNCRPYNCTECDKSFMRKRELERHMATHSGNKPFSCPTCEKPFGRKDKLMRHMRIHDTNREHVCVICGASFNRKDGLAHHMKTHARDTTDIALNSL